MLCNAILFNIGSITKMELTMDRMKSNRADWKSFIIFSMTFKCIFPRLSFNI